jgi:hypothetical protein
MVQGPDGVAICNECVELIVEMIEADRTKEWPLSAIARR